MQYKSTIRGGNGLFQSRTCALAQIGSISKKKSVLGEPDFLDVRFLTSFRPKQNDRHPNETDELHLDIYRMMKHLFLVAATLKSGNNK